MFPPPRPSSSTTLGPPLTVGAELYIWQEKDDDKLEENHGEKKDIHNFKQWAGGYGGLRMFWIQSSINKGLMSKKK